MEELKKFQSSTFDTITRRRLVEDRDTILELTGKIQELQNEINCMNDSRDFQDAESVRSGPSHVTSQPVSFPLHPVPGGMLSRPSIWDTHGISGNVFADPVASSCSTISAGIESMEFSYQNRFTHQRRRRMRIKQQFKIRDASPDRQPKNSVIPSEEILQRIMEQTNNDCRSQIFILTNSTTPATFACWKIRFKTEVCTCSQFPTEAMHWIKEVEMVDSVDDLKSSRSIKRNSMFRL